MTLRIRTTALVLMLCASAALQAKPAVRSLHVALVGDSLAYGAGDEEGKGLAGRLQPELQSRGVTSVVTTNLGRNGATTSEVGAKLRDAATRKQLANADAIVLSMGANDLREPLTAGFTESPLTLIEQVLGNIRAAVSDLRQLNPEARILILGAYTPLPEERVALFLEPLVTLWDSALAAQFADDPRVAIVRMSDIVDRPERLSPLDSFHPGGEAYQKAAARIAEMLTGSAKSEE